MSVAIRKLDGVESVQVSLNEGVATIELSPGSSVTPARVRQVVRDQGFTPKEAEIVVAGRIVARDEGWVLVATGSELEFVLGAHPDAPDALEGVGATEEESVVLGRLAEGESDNPAALQVKRIERRAH